MLGLHFLISFNWRFPVREPCPVLPVADASPGCLAPEVVRAPLPLAHVPSLGGEDGPPGIDRHPLAWR